MAGITLLFASTNLIIKLQKMSKKNYFFLGLINTAIIFALIFHTSCSSNSMTDEDKLLGSWLRSDGNYTITITEVVDDGKLVAKYFNPSPINIGKAGWRIISGKLQVYVELQDKNYPGSLYQLDYDEKTNTLVGTYYQAVSKQTYDVMFEKVIN